MKYLINSLRKEISDLFKPEEVLSEKPNIVNFSLLEAMVSYKTTDSLGFDPTSEKERMYILGYFNGFISGLDSDKKIKDYFNKQLGEEDNSRLKKLKGLSQYAMLRNNLDYNNTAIKSGFAQGSKDINKVKEWVDKSTKAYIQQLRGRMRIEKGKRYDVHTINGIKDAFNKKLKANVPSIIKTYTYRKLTKNIRNGDEELDKIKAPFDNLMVVYSLRIASKYRDEVLAEINAK